MIEKKSSNLSDNQNSELIYCKLENRNTLIAEKTVSKTKNGLILSPDGDIYHGNFTSLESPRYQGLGYFRSISSNIVYSGQFIKSKFDGFGQLVKSRYTYTGEFKAGKKNGYGFQKSKLDNQIIIGFYEEGAINGWCEHYRPDSGLYKGEMVKGERSGVGMLRGDKKIYFGEFEKNEIKGLGIRVRGQYKLETRLKEIPFDYFFGTWKRNKPSNYGIKKKGNESYEGEFSSGLRSGYGRLENLDPDEKFIYVGEFKKNFLHGFGKIEAKDYTYIGGWKEGKREGLGFYESKNGSYLGEWRNDSRNGLGIADQGSNEIRANWKDDLPLGNFFISISGSEIKTARMRNGKVEYISADCDRLELSLGALSPSEFEDSSNKKLKVILDFIKEKRDFLLNFYDSLQNKFSKEEERLRGKINSILVHSSKLKEKVNLNYLRLLKLIKNCGYEVHINIETIKKDVAILGKEVSIFEKTPALKKYSDIDDILDRTGVSFSPMRPELEGLVDSMPMKVKSNTIYEISPQKIKIVKMDKHSEPDKHLEIENIRKEYFKKKNEVEKLIHENKKKLSNLNNYKKTVKRQKRTAEHFKKLKGKEIQLENEEKELRANKRKLKKDKEQAKELPIRHNNIMKEYNIDTTNIEKKERELKTIEKGLKRILPDLDSTIKENEKREKEVENNQKKVEEIKKSSEENFEKNEEKKIEIEKLNEKLNNLRDELGSQFKQAEQKFNITEKKYDEVESELQEMMKINKSIKSSEERKEVYKLDSMTKEVQELHENQMEIYGKIIELNLKKKNILDRLEDGRKLEEEKIDKMNEGMKIKNKEKKKIEEKIKEKKRIISMKKSKIELERKIVTEKRKNLEIILNSKKEEKISKKEILIKQMKLNMIIKKNKEFIPEEVKEKKEKLIKKLKSEIKISKEKNQTVKSTKNLTKEFLEKTQKKQQKNKTANHFIKSIKHRRKLLDQKLEAISNKNEKKKVRLTLEERKLNKALSVARQGEISDYIYESKPKTLIEEYITGKKKGTDFVSNLKNEEKKSDNVEKHEEEDKKENVDDDEDLIFGLELSDSMKKIYANSIWNMKFSATKDARNRKKGEFLQEIRNLKKHLERLNELREQKEGERRMMEEGGEEEVDENGEVLTMIEKIKRKNLKFFRQKAEPELDAKLESAKKIDIDLTGEFMYTSCIDGVKIYDLTGQKISLIRTLEKYKNAHEVKALEKKRILIVYGKKNCIVVLDENFEEIVEIQGKETLKNPIKDSRFKSTQSTGNDKYFLWHSGQTSLEIFDTENFKTKKKIKDFWMYFKLKRTLIPIACASRKDSTRIFGFGMDSLTEETIMIFYKDKSKRSNQKLSNYAKYIDQLCCCEISQSGKMVYLGGTKSGSSLIGAIKFAQDFKPLKFQELDKEISEVSIINRVIGTDILLCGCTKGLMIVKLDKKNGTFIILCKYKNIGDFKVGSALFFERFLYGLMPESEMLVKFEYQKALDNKNFFKNEHAWWKGKNKLSGK